MVSPKTGAINLAKADKVVEIPLTDPTISVFAELLIWNCIRIETGENKILYILKH